MHFRAEPKDSGFRSFAEFYPYYLSEHRNTVSRVLHYLGTWGAILCLAICLIAGEPWWLVGALLSGYTFAWIGHFAFEKNRPATFQRPLYSFLGDWAMYRDILTGRLKV